MSVRPDSQRGCFWVASRSDPSTEHMVDLAANGGRGQCGCDNWKYRMSPRIASGQRGPSVWCSHVVAARDFLVQDMPDLSHRDKQKIINGVIEKWMLEENPSSPETRSSSPPLFGNGFDSEE